MSSNRILIRNGLLSGLQIALSSLGLLGAYRIISSNLGVAALGAWAICLSIGSLASLFDCGASDALVRLIAQKLARRDYDASRQLFSTAIIMSILGTTIGAFILFFCAKHLLYVLVAARNQSTFSGFFGAALLVGVLNTLGNACIGVLEGLERYDLKLVLSMAGIALFFAAIVVFVPRFGTFGMITAFVMQAAFVLIVGISIIVAKLSLFKGDAWWRPSAIYAAELIRTGLPLKAFGLASFALDPLTKVFVGSFGGMRAAGIYEVASRAVGQLRGLIVGIVQVTLPRFVNLSVDNPKQALAAEALSIRITGVIAICSFGSLVILLPWISQLLIGRFDMGLRNFALILSAGWFVNTLSAPYFYATVAAAHFHIVWTSTILMAAINALVGYILGVHFGAAGAVFGLSLAVTAGSAYTIGTRAKQMPMLRKSYCRPELTLGCVTALILTLSFAIPFRSSDVDQYYLRSTYSFVILLITIMLSVIDFYLNIRNQTADSTK